MDKVERAYKEDKANSSRGVVLFLWNQRRRLKQQERSMKRLK